MATKAQIPKPVDASDQDKTNCTEFPFLLPFEKVITARGVSTEELNTQSSFPKSKCLCPCYH